MKKGIIYTLLTFLSLFGLIFIALIIVLSFDSMGNKKNKVSNNTKASVTYKEHSLHNVTFEVKSNWSKKKGEKNVIYFYPDSDSLLTVSWQKADWTLSDNESRGGFIEGFKENKNNFEFYNEEEHDINGNIGYFYDGTTLIKGDNYKGRMFAVDTPDGLFVGMYFSKNGFSSQRKKELKRFVDSIGVEKVSYTDDDLDVSEEESSDESSDPSENVSNFKANDTSDASIESIVTYNDYLRMYELIINEYLTNYQNIISQYGVDASSLDSTKQQMSASLEQQRNQYGSMGNTKIVGKDTIVEFLKNYRDSLKSYTDSLATTLQ